MKEYHIIEVKYLSATNTSGTRVKLYSAYYNQFRIIPYDYQFNNTKDVAINWLKANGHKIIGFGENKKISYIICSATNYFFKSIK